MLALANRLGRTINLRLQLQTVRLLRRQFRRQPRQLVAQSLQLRLRFLQLLGQLAPFGHGHLRAQLLQPVAVFPIAARLGGLRADAAQPIADFFDNVGQPQQILIDSFQPPLGLDLLGLEATDAGRLFENRPAITRRRLQQLVDLALLDQAVGVRSRRRCRGTDPARLSAGRPGR